MAEEKKPNLKDRLKKTQVGMQNPAAPAGGGPAAPFAPPGGDIVAPPVAAGVNPPSIPAPSVPAIPGIPGLSADVAPPPFVAEQQAQQQAAAKAAAMAKAAADDPFGAAHATPSPQDIRIVVDERPVDDKEVGRSRTGTIVGILAAAVVAGVLGFVVGGQNEVGSQGKQTLLALGAVREKAQAAGNTLATVKTKLEAACSAANITGASEDQQQAAPAHPPEVNLDLVNWFRQDGGENAPFGPDVFATRMGRLDPNVSQKIAAVHVMFAQLWRDLNVHAAATGDGTAVRESLASAAQSSAMTLRLGMTFKQPQPNAPWVGVLTLAQQVNTQTGQVMLGAPLGGIPEPTRPRAIFLGNTPLQPAQLGGTFISVNVTDGLGPALQRGGALAWTQYRARLTALKQLVGQLDQAQQGLVNTLSGRRG